MQLFILKRSNNGGPHHNLPVSASGSQCRPAARPEPAVQRALFRRSSAAPSPAPLKARVPNGGIVAPK